MKRIVIGILCILFLHIAVAQSFPAPRDLYVNDFAGVLGSENVTYLHEMFALVKSNSTAEVVFVSMESINGEDISQYATNLGQSWGVGKQDNDNGVLILYVKDINKIWVATGYGVEGILPDSKVGRMLDETYVPERDAGNIEGGILDFSYALSEVLIENSAEITSGEAAGSKWTPFEIIIALLIFLIIVNIIIRLLYRGRNGSWGGVFIPGGGFGGGSGGGGGGFGGGGFGGGGAGR